jgi:hypothetical protein
VSGRKLWWHRNPDEKFWLYSFWVDSLEQPSLPLVAHSTTHFGNRERPWNWTLISEIQPSDIVMLWAVAPAVDGCNEDIEGALVGYAVACSGPSASEELSDIRDVHFDHLEDDRRIRLVEIELCHHKQFDSAIPLSEIRQHEEILKQTRDRMRRELGLPPYGPWFFSEWRRMGVSDGAAFKLSSEDVKTLKLLDRPAEGVLQTAETFEQGAGWESWRSRFLADGQIYPVSKLRSESLDAVVGVMISQIEQWDEEKVILAVKEFLGMKKTSSRLRRDVQASIERVVGIDGPVENDP